MNDKLSHSAPTFVCETYNWDHGTSQIRYLPWSMERLPYYNLTTSYQPPGLNLENRYQYPVFNLRITE